MSDQKKNYRMSYEGFDMHIEVDHAVLTDERLRDWLDFWPGADVRIEESGTPFKAYMSMLCREFLSQTVITFDPKNVFDMGNVDGFPSLDGKHGITLITFDCFELDGDVEIFDESGEGCCHEASHRLQP